MNRFLSKDFLSGVMFIAFGLVALWFGRHLALGTSVRMGPGYVPHMLAFILMGLGLIISVVALYAGSEPVEAPKWRPITLVTIGIVVFALLFERTGMFPALAALVLIASLGGDEFKLTEVVVNMLVLAVLCTIVFWVGLRMNIGILYIRDTDVGANALEPIRSGIYAAFGAVSRLLDAVRSLF